ncbi:DUF1289 domain-containing protein [Halomonas sp. SSL-5]|uniref:DUF1289 domain-containing protein n=1 Tax=Halomonas sp. SSL-5 TaxID=3065855 RepID=UPI0027392032|nr:DUF1289 domain-containing protein [Halomonas sp. SSL-5]MDY7114868.1 DUF1289 domain-containing protein [Halomonas sp. SSL-5]
MRDMRSERPASPCVRVCRVLPADSLCEGCGRTLDEIATWARLDEDGREAIWQRLEAEGWPVTGDAPA